MNCDDQANLPKTSPFGRKLLQDLRDAGETGLNPSRLKIDGAEKEFRKLNKLGYAVSLDGVVYLSIEAYEKHVGAIVKGRKTGDKITISDARENTGLSRKYILPILNRMEAEGYLKRVGDARIVLEPYPGEKKRPGGHPNER